METVSTESPPHKAFEFGANWRRFLERVDDTRITQAVRSLEQMLGPGSLTGKTFLDAGSGSGLFSLAAAKLGAKVLSFDIDPQSVACTTEMKRRFGTDLDWTILSGSALDAVFLQSLGTFDVVYSWGVLHHTGNQWQAIDLVQQRVAPGGRFFLSLYNDQGDISRYWTLVKRIYNGLPRWLRTVYVLLILLIWGGFRTLFVRLPLTVMAAVFRLLRFKNPFTPLTTLVSDYTRTNSGERGMHRWYDLVDWVGGWPFEVSRPEQVLSFLRDRGFELHILKTCGGNLGCNEFLFQRNDNR